MWCFVLCFIGTILCCFLPLFDFFPFFVCFSFYQKVLYFFFLLLFYFLLLFLFYHYLPLILFARGLSTICFCLISSGFVSLMGAFPGLSIFLKVWNNRFCFMES